MLEKKDNYSYAGEILFVNLSNHELRVEPTNKYVKEWLGSSGIAAKLLYDGLKPWVTPYDPANRLIISSGVLVGTIAPGANKMNVSALSPVTGGWGSSCSDSYLGGQLKNAGYDAVVIEGRSRNPVYIFIDEGQVSIIDGSKLWGKTTWESLDLVREELGDPNLHTLGIGPAGENLVRPACIIQDRNRAFGRCGLGSVMGSKNLKLITARGKKSVKVAEPDKFKEAAFKARKMFDNAANKEGMATHGTLGIYPAKQEMGGIIYKNFQDLQVPEEVYEQCDPRKMIDKFQISRQSFPGCAYGGCGRHIAITEGPYAGFTSECGQWEAFSTLMTRLAVTDPTFMVKANAMCNQLGMDIDATGGAIGWAMECYQRGIIDEDDTDGLKLEWGNADVILQLIEKISKREGFGNILAEGCAKASEMVGRDSGYYAMHIKGQDLYEPLRGANGWCLGTTTSTRGGGHTTGAVSCETGPALDKEKARELFGIENADKKLEYEGRAKMVQYTEVLTRVNNSLGVCHFNTAYWDVQLMELPQLAELYSAATGLETSVDDLWEIAMRQLNLEKAINLLHTNFDRKDDMPTPRDLNEPIPSGLYAGWQIDLAKYNEMLDDYYEIHGWDKSTSYPKRETLEKLGLGYVADELENIGKVR